MQLSLSALETTKKIIDNIYIRMEEKGWTLTRLSIESGVPYDSVKKYLSYKVENPHYYNLIRICYSLDMDLGDLLPQSAYTPCLSPSQASHTMHLVEYVKQLENSISVCESYKQKDYIPVFRPIGIRESSSLQLDSFSMMLLEAGGYRERYGNRLACGIEVRTPAYHPVYMENDILLIGKDRPPAYGETGVFIHNGQIYLRRFLNGTPIQLESINGLGETITLESLEGWFIFGYVLTVYR